jgi:hypothetical protein
MGVFFTILLDQHGYRLENHWLECESNLSLKGLEKLKGT